MKKFRFLACFIIMVTVAVCLLSFNSYAEESDFFVSSVSAANAVDGATLKWKACDGADAYALYRAEDTGDYEKLLELPDDTLSYTDMTVSSGKIYKYKVKPVKESVEGECKKEASLAYLAAPSSLKAANDYRGVKITWKKTDGASGYNIYRKAPSDKSWAHAGFVGDVSLFIDKKVEDANEYIYTVRAKDKNKNTSNYNKTGVSISYVKAPELKNISNTAKGIRISWNKLPDADSYTVYRRVSSGSWCKLATLSKNYSAYTDTTIQPEKGYAYTVRATRGDSISGFFSGLSYRFLPVVNVSTVKNQAEGLLVKWQSSPYATGYKLYRKGPTDTSWKKIATVNGKSNVSYTDKKVDSSKQYTYTIITVNDKYQSTFDSTGKSATYVAIPQNVSFALTSGKNTVRWNKVTGATHYYIYRRTESESGWTKLARIGNKNSYMDSTAKTGVVYFYCVRAGINGKSFSTYSKEVRSGKVDPTKKMVALTYDDGPSSTTTNRILDMLEKYDSRATFFVVGSRVDSYSSSLIRVSKLGCEIGNHTYSHINLPSYSDSAIRSDISKTDSLVKKYTGITPSIARAPGGAFNQRVMSAAGKPFIQWSVDTRDWEHRNASKTVAIIKNNVRDGSIILMHDLYPATASASETIIPWLVNNGYQLVTVSELMQYRGINMKTGNAYYNGYKK